MTTSSLDILITISINMVASVSNCDVDSKA